MYEKAMENTNSDLKYQADISIKHNKSSVDISFNSSKFRFQKIACS